MSRSKSLCGQYLTILLCLIGLAACTATAPRPAPSRALLQNSLDAIRSTYRLPGATAAIVFRDGSMVSVASGFADAEAGTPMTPETRMLAGSIGKTFVAATILSLAEEGRLDLDEAISHWLGHRDWFARLPNADDITVRQLLSHRSGLPDHVHSARFMEAWSGGQTTPSPETLIGFVLDEPPLFAACEGWSYSDTGYLLLGMIIEAATGHSYEAEVRSRFLNPVQLNHSGPSNTKVIEGLATGYVSSASGLGLPQRTTDEQGHMVWNPSVEWTGGGLFSTAEDLARWGHALFGGSLLSVESLESMLAGKPTGDGDARSEYGLGVAILTDSPWGRSAGHRGWIPGYVSSLRYFPEQGVAIAFQINSDIGIVGEDRPVVMEIENRLAAVAFAPDQAR